MKFYKKLRVKKFNRTKRKLVFNTETGELAVISDHKIQPKDIIIDAIFNDQGVF